MIKAIIFDKDGVITDSIYFFYEITKGSLEKHGIKITFKHFYHNCVELMHSSYNTYKPPIPYEQFTKERKELYFNLFEKSFKTMPHIIEQIKLLHKTYPLGLATSNFKFAAEFELEKMGIKSLFTSILTGEDIENNKPNPEIYLKSAKNLNIDPKHCIAIEDTNVGLKSAKSAGMRCVIIRNDHNQNIDFSEADYIIKDASELYNTIQKINNQ